MSNLKRVRRITLNAETKEKFNLNLIEFEDGYSALEKNVDNSSSFKTGLSYEVVTWIPGGGSKLDWINRVEKAAVMPEGLSAATPNTKPPDLIAPQSEVNKQLTSRDYLFVAQRSLDSAISYTTGQANDPKTILAIARTFAEGIIRIAFDLDKTDWRPKPSTSRDF